MGSVRRVIPCALFLLLFVGGIVRADEETDPILSISGKAFVVIPPEQHQLEIILDPDAGRPGTIPLSIARAITVSNGSTGEEWFKPLMTMFTNNGLGEVVGVINHLLEIRRAMPDFDPVANRLHGAVLIGTYVAYDKMSREHPFPLLENRSIILSHDPLSDYLELMFQKKSGNDGTLASLAPLFLLCGQDLTAFKMGNMTLNFTHDLFQGKPNVSMALNNQLLVGRTREGVMFCDFKDGKGAVVHLDENLGGQLTFGSLGFTRTVNLATQQAVHRLTLAPKDFLGDQAVIEYGLEDGTYKFTTGGRNFALALTAGTATVTLNKNLLLTQDRGKKTWNTQYTRGPLVARLTEHGPEGSLTLGGMTASFTREQTGETVRLTNPRSRTSLGYGLDQRQLSLGLGTRRQDQLSAGYNLDSRRLDLGINYRNRHQVGISLDRGEPTLATLSLLGGSGLLVSAYNFLTGSLSLRFERKQGDRSYLLLGGEYQDGEFLPLLGYRREMGQDFYLRLNYPSVDNQPRLLLYFQRRRQERGLKLGAEIGPTGDPRFQAAYQVDGDWF